MLPAAAKRQLKMSVALLHTPLYVSGFVQASRFQPKEPCGFDLASGFFEQRKPSEGLRKIEIRSSSVFPVNC